MEYRGKKVLGIEIYDSSDNDKVIATICDDCMMLDNGYKARVLPYVEEKTDDK